MNNGFFDALSLLGAENSVETEILVEKVKSALLKAIKKAYPDCDDIIRVDIDPKTKKLDMILIRTVVDDEPVYINEINIDEARTVDPNAYVGGTVEYHLDAAKFGRAAAQSAKQSIKGDLREINRENILSQFQDKENDCITVKVSQVEAGGTVTVVYDKTELYLFKDEQIPGERLKEDQIIKVYIKDIVNKSKKPIVKISRAHRELVKRLFEVEVPEIYEGIVEIKSISREAGSRTKVAVWSKDKNIDAIGACIGDESTRIKPIVEELSGEKIDIINYSEDPAEFVANALAPAKVLRVEIAEGETKECRVIVPNDQLSLAIGNRGQNAKLAAKLTGYKIDIKPEFEIPVKSAESTEPEEKTEEPIEETATE